MEHWDGRRRHPNDARSKLERWILSAGGGAAVARMIDTHHVTISGWLSRRAVPSLEMTVRLIKAANGKLSAIDIWESTKP